MSCKVCNVMYWVLALHYWHLCETHKWNDSHCLPGVKTTSAMQMKLLLITCFLLEPTQPFTWQKSGRVSDQNYESMIIFLRPFLFPPIQWCTFTKNSFSLPGCSSEWGYRSLWEATLLLFVAWLRLSALNYRSGCILMKTIVFYFDFHL